MGEYKVIVLGGGPGGYVAAIRSAQLGFKTLLIEKDKLGGTCLNRGCIPTKALLESAGRWEEFQKMAAYGINVEGSASVDMHKIQERKSAVVSRMLMGLDGLMKKNGITVVNGIGCLTSPNSVQVGETVYTADYIILAMGSQVMAPKSFPVDGKHVVTSDQILQNTTLPKSMIVVGSGAVGMEFASLYARLGTQVSVVEMLPKVLPLEDDEVSAECQRLCRKKNINVYLNSRIEKIKVVNGKVAITGDGLPDAITAEMLLVAVGRSANLEGLGQVDINLDRGQVVVDEYMRTSVPNIYAIGDLVPTPKLAHVASAEGILAVEHLAGLNPKPINYNACPGATYCTPEVASVGLTQSQAEAKGIKVKVGKFPFVALGKAAVIGETDGFVKIIANEEDSKVLGVHIIGPHATDLISEGVVAVQCGLTLEDLALSIHPHPTLGESIMEASHAALGKPINFVPVASRRARK